MEQTLIDKIIKEVLRRLALKNEQKILALFSSAPEYWDLAEKQIEILEKNHFTVNWMMTPEAERIKEKRNYAITNDYTMTDYSNVDNILQTIDVVILPTLSINSISKIACGYYDNLVTKFIMEALFQNKKVIAANGFLGSLNMLKNDYLKDKFMKYVFEIQAMGIVLVKPNCLAETVLEVSDQVRPNQVRPNDLEIQESSPPSPLQECRHFTGKILDANSLMALEVPKISYREGTLITALAEDYAKEKEIQLIKMDH